MTDLPARTFLPVRLFHATVSGILIGTLLTLGVFQLQQKLFAATSIANFRGNGWNTYVPPSQAGTANGTHAPTTDDEDGDEIPNSWETTYLHNPQMADDAAYDFDFDGLTEKQEYDLSVRTNGAYGNPLGKFKLVSIPTPPGFSTIGGVPRITAMELIESAKNGTSLFRISGLPIGQPLSTRIFTYSPLTQAWTVVTPPSNYSNATLYPTDINSQGQVVGSLNNAGSYKGFCWTPDGSAQGGASQEFFLNTSGTVPAIPKRISDTGYLLYYTSTNNTLKAADPKRRPIDPISNPWTTPQFVDVNDMGEYVGMIPDLSTGEYKTFLAIPGGPVFLTSMSIADAAWWIPDTDPSQIEWESPMEEFFDVDGYSIPPEYVSWYLYGEIFDSEGNLVDPADYQFQYGTRVGSPVSFRRSWGSDEIWWNWGDDVWEFMTFGTAPPTALNDWGEFTGPYTLNWLDQIGNNTPEGYSVDGHFFYDGSYHSYEGQTIAGISNDPQILLRNNYSYNSEFSLFSDNVSCPLADLLPPGTPLPLNARLCDNGLIVLQTATKSFSLFVPDDDSDGDGMPDDWEVNYGFNPAMDDANGDADHDGTSNYGEFLLRTDPTAAPAVDPDGNEIDTRPGIDTDADGIPNSWEWANGLNYNDAADAAGDFDRDGYTNLQEYQLNTDPRGVPSFRIREIGPFPGTSAVTLSSAVLGAGESSANDQTGTNVTDSVTFLAIGASPNPTYDRPAKWSWHHPDTSSTFMIYPVSGNQASTKVAFSTNGAALTRYSSNPIMFSYWGPSASPGSPISFSGASNTCNIKSLNSLSISPSGNYVAGMRMNDSSIWEPVIWKMSANEVPIVLPLPASVSISSVAKIEVNDAGYAAATCMYGPTSCTLLWHVVGTTVGSPTVLPTLIAGGWTTLAGISNTSPPVVGGNAVLSTGKTHAVYWSQSGQIVDLGTLGGSASSLSLVSGDGHMAGTSEVLVDNTLKYQTFIATPHRNAGSQTIISVTNLAQGDPVAYGAGNIVLKSIADSGEVLGTTRPNGNEANPIPTLWHHGRSYSLDAALPPSSGYTLSSVDALNGCGTVLATAWKDGYSARILLTPDRDTDGDGMPDAFENQNNFNPFVKDNAGTDSDADGLADIEEYRNGTNPRNTDTDGDGMKDGWEVSWGLLPLDPGDAALDPDNDRVTNLRESQIGTNPTGIYRVEVLSTFAEGSFQSAADDGSVIVQTPPHSEGYANVTNSTLITAPDAGGQRHGLSLPSDWQYYTADEITWYEEYFEVKHYNSGNGIVRSWEWDYAGGGDFAGGSFYDDYNSYYLIDNSADNESPWVDFQTINTDLRGASILSGADSLSPWELMVSTEGSRRIHTAGATYLILDSSGNYVRTLQSGNWSAINNPGRVAGVVTRTVPASGAIPGHMVTDIRISNEMGQLTTFPLPASWFPVSQQPTIQAFSDDGQVLLRRQVTNPDGTTRYEFHLLDTSSGQCSLVKQPGLGNELINLVSQTNGRLLGTGSKPFQITPDGTCIRIGALRIKNSPTQSPFTFGSLYSGTLTVNHVASDGRITVTTTNSSNQPVVLQIVPYNDSDNDGVPDDWELANGLTGSGDPNPGTVPVSQQDTDNDGLTNLHEYQMNTNPNYPDHPAVQLNLSITAE